MHIPPLVPFNFVEAENIDYKTVFPNPKNTQPDKRLMHPNWGQVVPIDIEIIFFIWTTSGGITLDSTLGATIVISEQITSSTDTLWKVSITFTELGNNTLTLTGDGETHISNEFEILENLQDEMDEYIYIQFSNFENDFDYWFNDGVDYFPIWCKIINRTPISMTDVETYEGEENNSEVTRSFPNKGITYITPAIDEWFGLVLTNVFACSLIKVNGIDYSPESSAKMDQLDESLQQSIVEITLQNK